MRLPCVEQGGDNANGGRNWDDTTLWLNQMTSAVLICVENAEVAMRSSAAEVRVQLQHIWHAHCGEATHPTT